MKDFAFVVGIMAAFWIVQAIFGRVVSIWLALIVMAFCIGVFWGAGDQIRKHREGK